MKYFWMGFWVFAMLLILIGGVVAGADAIQSAIDYTGRIMSVLAWALVSFVIGTFALAFWFGFAFVQTWRRGQDLKQRRPRDGAFALQQLRLNNGEMMIFDPNQMASAAAIINTKTGHVADVEPGMGWHLWQPLRVAIQQTRLVQAMYPGDDVRDERSKAPTVSAAAVRSLAASKPPQITVDGTAQRVAELPAYRVIDGPASAVAQSESQAWILGQSPTTGALAAFNPKSHAHLGIIGSTGTGKTSSAGFLVASEAIWHGWHTVILDPDGGEDWGAFSNYAEWHEADRETFADQVRAVYAEYERRVSGGTGKPLFVIIEEYGDMIQQLRIVRKKDADQVDNWLDSILRRGRKQNISLCFVDQYPEHWSPQVIGGTKAKAVFKLGPNQGAKVEEYHANKLPEHGAFLWRGEQYQTWHAKPQVRALLAGSPALNGYRLLNGSERLTEQPYQRETNTERTEQHRMNGAIPPPIDPPFDVRSHPKREVIEWWIDNVGGTQADFRRWADGVGFDASRGYVSDVFNGKYTGGEDGSGGAFTVEDLARLDEPIYINGQPLGKDPTITVRY